MNDPRKTTPNPDAPQPEQDMIPNPQPGPKPHDDSGQPDTETFPNDPLSPGHDPSSVPPPM